MAVATKMDTPKRKVSNHAGLEGQIRKVQIPPSAPNRESLECNSFRDFSYFTALLSFSRCTKACFTE